MNVTSFGSFVDIGLERDALIHSSKSNGIQLQPNQTVKAQDINTYSYFFILSSGYESNKFSFNFFNLTILYPWLQSWLNPLKEIGLDCDFDKFFENL